MQRVSTLLHYLSGEQAIMERSRELLAAQQRVATGKRITTPADDPVGAATGSTLRTGLARLDQFKSNQSQAQFVLGQSENAVAQFNDALLAVKDKLLAAANGTYGDAQRQMVAGDLEGILAQMVGLANTSDGAGGYLFAGTREAAAPFAQSGTLVSYSGDATAQRLEVANNRLLPTRLTGDDVFLRMRPGNGTFTTAAATTNAGSGIIDVGGVVDPSQVTGSGYTIDFDGAQFVVTRASDSAQFTFAAANGPNALQFDGVRVTITGQPAAGDRFTVQPAGYQSIFDTMAQAIATLRTPGANAALLARIHTQIGGALASIDQAIDHMSLKRAQIGAALAEVDGYQQLHESRSVELQGRLSAVEDVDFAQAISELSRRQDTFTAAIKSYSSVSRLSLFDYL
jgi:flagellar hook-associated protein 3 FlgL